MICIDGWIKLHRKLLDNPIFDKPELLQLFIYCLLKANHEPQKIIFNGQETEVSTGQFITGRTVIARDLGQKPITTYKRLKILKNIEILNIESNNRFSLVTVVNYGMYQSEEIKRNSKSNNKGTTREQLGNTNKNVKNDKNEKKKIYAEFVTLLEEEYEKLLVQFGEQDTKDRITRLSLYKHSTGKKYKSDYATILNWARKDDAEKGGESAEPSKYAGLYRE